MNTITLHSEAQAREVLGKAWDWIRRRVSDGRAVRLSLADEQRSLSQNDAIQAVVRDIAKQAEYADHDRLRMLLCEQWRHETKRPAQYFPSLDGLRMIDGSNRTSKLDRGDASEFLDWLQAWKAQHEL